MQELFSLGKLYPSDFLKPEEQPRCEPVEMKMMLDENGTARLEKTAPPEAMWGKYWYRSSISETMRKQLRDVVDSVLDVMKLDERHLMWCDLAGNDGYLLSQVPESFIRINIDPADDSFRLEAEKHCDLVIQDYFSADVFKKSKFGKLKAKVVTCISMFYDLSDPDTFLEDVKEVMDDNGLFVLQLSYTPLMLEQLEFSNICHEHLFYYSLFNIKKLLEKHGFKIMDVSLNDTNAGSFRLHVMKKIGDEKLFGSHTHRDVCNFRMAGLLSYEKTLRVDEADTWLDFFKRINELKTKTVDFIKEQKSLGKSVFAYGASTKGNSLLQFFNLDSTLITAIAERSPQKFGTRTIGSNIPIISEDEMRKKSPDFLLILPFHFLNEFIEREKEYLDNGGQFIVPLPVFQIIGKQN
jgi:hypothetical protein